MKKLIYLSILLLGGLFIFVSCQKDEEVPMVNEFMTATVNGQAYKASTFVVARAGVTTSINGTFGHASSPESIGLSVRDAKVGTFLLEEGGEDYAVYNSATGEYISMLGTLQINTLSEEWIAGNFNFTAYSIIDPEVLITISNGEFKIKMD